MRGARGPNLWSATPTAATTSSSTTAQLPAFVRVVLIYEPV